MTFRFKIMTFHPKYFKKMKTASKNLNKNGNYFIKNKFLVLTS